MVLPISSLANMEMALYGGLGTSAVAPSYINGYMGTSSDLYSNPYTNYATNYNNSIFNNANQSNPYANQKSQNQQVPVNSDMKTLADYYAKNLEPSESLLGAVGGGAVMGAVMMNPRIIAHPYNYITTAFKGDTVDMFKGVKQNGALKDLWKKHHYVMEEAYSQMNRAEARSKSRWTNLFRKGYTTEEYEHLKGIMKEALESGDEKQIAKATETLRHAYSNNGHIPHLIDKIRGKESSTVFSRLETGAETIAKNADELLGYNSKMTIKKAFKKSGGWFALLFGAVEILMNKDKIAAAFAKDKENAKFGKKTNLGKQQVTQTAVKATANTLGWAAGETLAIWGAAKAGAAIGTTFGPGIGTAVGAIAGFVGGSIGMWLGGKTAKAVVGEDVSNEIQAENLAKSQEGQFELLQFAASNAQDGKLPANVQLATQRVLSQYA